MILDFADPETATIWAGAGAGSCRRTFRGIAPRKLRLLNQARVQTRVLLDLRIPPGNRLEGSKADRAGQYSIRINDQWRICFIWREGGPSHVEIVDCHD